MKLRSGISFVGALVAGGAVVGLYFAVGVWILLAVGIGLGLVGYIVASLGFASRSAPGFGEFMRGWLVGQNAGLNAMVVFAILESASVPAGVVVGAVLGLFNLLSVFHVISQSEAYQGILGWINWLMPMSWLIVGLGILFYLVSFLLHLVAGRKVEYLRIQDADADWKTGTFFIKGGLVANLNYADTAFNMGNFSFVDYKSGGWHKEHEAGHTLNLAAFGWVFHLVGALDENVTRRGANALSERLAESNATGAAGSNIPMWS